MTHSQIQAWLDQEDEHVAQTIRKYGQFIQLVSGSSTDLPPVFAYTVGLFGLGHPELVMTGGGMDTSGHVLNSVGRRIRDGDNLISGQVLTVDGWPHRVMVETLPNPGEIVFAANRHYQRPAEVSVPAYQLTPDDGDGRFPGDPDYAGDPLWQPRPGRWRA